MKHLMILKEVYVNYVTGFAENDLTTFPKKNQD